MRQEQEPIDKVVDAQASRPRSRRAPAAPTVLRVSVMALGFLAHRFTLGGGTRAYRSAAATVTLRSPAGDLGCRCVERHLRRSREIALDWRGTLQVWARLRVIDGIRVARKRVLRLMRENGLLSPHRHLPRQGAGDDGRIITAGGTLVIPLAQLLIGQQSIKIGDCICQPVPQRRMRLPFE